MKKALRKIVYLYGVLFAMAIVLFWGNKITAKADYYFTLENNVLSTSTDLGNDIDIIASNYDPHCGDEYDTDIGAYVTAFPYVYGSTAGEGEWLSLFSSENIHLEVKGNNSIGNLEISSPNSTIFGDGNLSGHSISCSQINGANITAYSVSAYVINGGNISASEVWSTTINGGQISSPSIKNKVDNTNKTAGQITKNLPDILQFGYSELNLSDYMDQPINIASCKEHSYDGPIMMYQYYATNAVPSGMSLSPNGVISGYPKEKGLYSFLVEITDSSNNTSLQHVLLNVKDNSTIYQRDYADPGYELSKTVPAINPDQLAPTYELVSVGNFADFQDLYLDGYPLTRNIDYTAVAGSTRITIQAQVFEYLSYGQHSLMLEFRTADTGELRTASQLFTVTDDVTKVNNQVPVQTAKQETTSAPVIQAANNVLYGTLLEDGRYLVGSGDNLSRIAREYLESEKNWKKIYQLNTDIIKDPNLIYKGQIFRLQ